MKKLAITSLAIAQACISAGTFAQAPTALSVTLGSIEDNRPIPSTFAYCMQDGAGKTKDGGNINPAIRWSGAPAATKSFALIVVDKDVPASFELANQPGKVIPADFPRQDFYHWVLVDIPAATTGLQEGQDSKGIIPGGRAPGKADYGVNGQNSYAMGGKDLGGSYDGPCPPWNDERLHHYYFRVYALDVPSLGLSGNFTGKQAEDAMTGHILAKGEVVGTYTNNPKLSAH